MVAKKRLTEDERAANVERLNREFDERAKREDLRPCKSCNGHARLDRKSLCVECVDDCLAPTKQLPTGLFGSITISGNNTAKVEYA